ncbi:MAG: ankyrin repeat domain-containing protein [Gammaproteobacteria bacterium]
MKVRKLIQGIALAAAVAGGGIALAIEAPADAGPDWRGPDGSTALQWAVYEGDVERAQELIDAGADVTLANNYGANAMQLAAEVANVEMLKLLLDAGADADSPNPEGQTALMLVARTGNVEAAELLVAHGATVDAREGWGQQTALMWASARRHPQMMEFLISKGADVDAQSIARDYPRHVTKEGRAKNLDAGGLTPLMYAIRENCLSCVQVLIQHGVDLNKPDPEGVSPLTLALINAHWDAAKALIEANADVQQWDNFGQAPLLAAVSHRSDVGLNPNQPPQETDGLAIVRMLLERGANPNMQLFMRPSKARGGPLSRGTTPLIVAASNGDLEAIELLLQHGAKADLPQADLQTPISALAGARGAPDRLTAALDALIAAGADPNVVAVHHHLQRTRGGAPLHYAVRAGNTAMVEALVARGADVNIVDKDGLTPLDHAMQRNQVPFLAMRRPPNTALADKLRSLGANKELDATPFWPNVGPPFYYPWSVFPLDPQDELAALVPGSFDHQ